MRFSVIALMFLQLGVAQNPTSELNKLYKEFYNFELREYPEFATSSGINDYDDRWTDLSPAAVQRRKAEYERMLAVARKFKTDSLPQPERLNHTVFLRELEDRLRVGEMEAYFGSARHFQGPSLSVFSIMPMMPARTVKDYENRISRLEALPAYTDGLAAAAEEGLRRKMQSPRRSVDLLVEQIEAQMLPEPAKSPLLKEFQKMPASIPEAEQQRLRQRAETAYVNSFRPAWKKMRNYFAETYAPRTRDAIGMAANDNGAEYYAEYVKSRTTTNLSPAEIHEIGLREMARIDKEMASIRQELSFSGTAEEFADRVLGAKDMLFHSEAEILAHGRDIAKRIDPELPRLFEHLARMPYGVAAIPADRARTAAPYYQGPALDGSRAGYFFLRTVDPEKQSKCCMEALILHEAVPGHHLQIALAREMPETPDFRKTARYTAFTEGWGLYAETLGTELHLYETPYERYGKLQQEVMRAARLVVDTGIHSLGWSRERAIETMRPARGGWINDEFIDSEVDRYIAIPGQALAYKIGGLKIQQLRARAEKELGAKFDIRKFHDAVLRNGALPLDILEEQVESYISRARAMASSSP